MSIPFLDLFKKLTGRFGGSGTTVTEAPARPASRVIRPKKSEAERLSKTVMPNTTRSFSPPDPFRSAAATTATPRSSMPLELGARKITASGAKPRPSQLPPALARALEPKVERTISLRVADLIDAVPAGFIKPVEILDTNAIVSLKASELEKGMPDKHPTISLPSLYQQVPEIFLRSVRSDDDTRVELPYLKVLEQFQNAHVRTDQVRDPAIPHVDTPILTATIQDSERFGTKIDSIETSTFPSVPVKHATAESIADAEPDATPAQPTTPAKPAPADPRVISLHSLGLKPKSETPDLSPTETKIPFNLSPNGTGASASERVPASSGPPVPTPLPFNPEFAKIAFEQLRQKAVAKQPEAKTHLPAPSAKAPDEKPATPATKTPSEEPLTLRLQEPAENSVKVEKPVAPTTPSKAPAEQSVAPMSSRESSIEKHMVPAAKTMPVPSIPMAEIVSEPAKDQPSISFSVKAVLQNLPAFQLTGDLTTLSADARFKLPLALVESQLASGRVTIAPDVFQAALPEKHRGLFQIDVTRMPVALPLEEVLKNLPAMVLKLRDDQESLALEKDFETPFLLKAREDERRLTPKTESTETISKQSAKQPRVVAKGESVSVAMGATESVPTKPAVEKIDPKEIVAQANGLSGVKACAITFSDGLSLAGELPEEVEADGLCAMAPSMLERIAQHVNETKLGQLMAMTLYATGSAVSFFARGNVCLTALHDRPLTPETRTGLAALVEKLSKTYTQPETPNVDH
jgi:predicted regulator of Ras-like GTPase activity (Roadblock/LC7/MglB family)